MNFVSKEKNMSNPFSTGGGGTVFELKVQTSLLGTLLVGGHVPAFNNALIEELHLQAEHLDYETDDALAICLDKDGLRRRQLWSVKHEVRFTEHDEVFQSVVADTWADFLDTKRFDCNLDAFILATGPMKATNKHLITLLEFARASVSATDFLARVNRKQAISQKSRDYLSLFQKVCNKVSGKQIEDDELWKFLCCFHIVGYDFDQTASQDEARFKTLLALAMRKDTGKTGDELWNTIFKWIADRNPRAGSFTRENLPSDWQQTALSIAQHFESGVIYRLLEHSRDLLKRIRTSIGQNLHLKRQELTERLAEAFVNEQFTLVTGQAGVGKSAAALVALQEILNGAPLFVFQATEFARDNLDHALADLRVTETLSRISALFALHPRKFMLIESVERLLESTQRDAFFMLLARLSEDTTWRVVLTCRQYSLSMVRDAFLKPLGINCVEIDMPLLSQAELDYVIQNVPGLRPVASNSRSRELLRNPWYLDKACSVDWNKETATELLDERRLRDVLWRQVVVREDMRIGGMHLQRERCFRDIALRRARSLQSFVAVEAGEEAAVQALVADELLVEEPRNRWVAPAHDVLEDWALVRWVSETFMALGHEPQQFFDTLGHELPIRRSYRQWLQEALVAEDLEQMRGFVDAVLSTPSVELYWRDETLVSILLSDEAPRFVESHEPALLTDNKRQLQRIIHLLRVACKKPNPLWALPEEVLGKTFGDIHLVPDGKAWGAVIQLIHRNLLSFENNDLPLVLGFLEDWKAGINWQMPVPDAAREAGLIALHYWNSLDNDWHWEETFDRLASLILVVPQAISAEFEALLNYTIKHKGRNYRAEALEKKLLTSFECWAACRSHSEAVAKFAERGWGIDRPIPKKSSWDVGHHLDMNTHFGLRSGFLDYHPASALQGPFFALLQAKPQDGIDLVLKLANVATERFVKLGLDDKYNDGPVQVIVDFGEGVVSKQWMSPRLWLMYREGMPGPEVFQSALMALEKWLLDLAEADHDLQNLTRRLILKSKSVSITAVVTSVALAYPFKIGDTALTLLRTPEFFDLDLRRFVYDQNPVSSMFGDWPYNASKRIYNNERLDSDKLPHRKKNLEWFALTLQTGALRDQVWKIIDDYKVELPPLDKQTEEHKMWRFLLHKIDLRNFSPKEKLDDGKILFEREPPERDVAEVIDKNAPALEANEEATSVLVWGMAVFEQRDMDKFDMGRWREMLKKAQQLADVQKNKDMLDIRLLEGGPGYVAAVCVRDHWEELNPEEKKWCRELLLSKIMAEKDTGNEMVQIQRFAMASSRAAARVLPLFLDDADEITRKRVREAIAAALTHAIKEVREYAAHAVGLYLWERDADLASACIAALIDLATLERWCYGRRRQKPFNISKGVDGIRMRITSGKSLKERHYSRIDVVDPFNATILPLISVIISQQQARPLAQKFLCQISESFVQSWKREHRYDGRRNYQAESILKSQFANFIIRCEVAVALKLWEPFANAIPQNADEVAEVFERMIISEDATHESNTFWAVWQETVNRLLSSANCHEQLAREHSGLAKLSSVLLLDRILWKEDAKDWKPLHGHENKLKTFFEAAGSAPPVCKSFIRLLDSVGSILLPEALVWLDGRLRHGNPTAMIGDRNALFSLARILTPLVFSQTNVLRKSPILRNATLHILDLMVEQGSSAAFRMRDFLVTPIAPSIT